MSNEVGSDLIDNFYCLGGIDVQRRQHFGDYSNALPQGNILLRILDLCRVWM